MEPLLEAVVFSRDSSAATFLSLRTNAVVASLFGSSGFFTAGGADCSPDSVRGDSGIGWPRRLVLGVAPAMLSAKMFVSSFRAGGVEMSESPLNLRVAEMLESWLFSRWSPILPSFSMAMKFVRTLESGRGDSLAILGGIPGERPRSGGLVSPFCSNMALRFLTPLMVAVFGSGNHPSDNFGQADFGGDRRSGVVLVVGGPRAQEVEVMPKFQGDPLLGVRLLQGEGTRAGASPAPSGWQPMKLPQPCRCTSRTTRKVRKATDLVVESRVRCAAAPEGVKQARVSWFPRRCLVPP